MDLIATLYSHSLLSKALYERRWERENTSDTIERSTEKG
jgi:hypothetical protein